MAEHWTQILLLKYSLGRVLYYKKNLIEIGDPQGRTALVSKFWNVQKCLVFGAVTPTIGRENKQKNLHIITEAVVFLLLINKEGKPSLLKRILSFYVSTTIFLTSKYLHVANIQIFPELETLIIMIDIVN